MRVISKRPLREFRAIEPEAEIPLKRWFKIVERAEWPDFASLRVDFPQADVVGDLVVLNVAGNKYRLIAEVDYGWRRVYVRAVLTHGEYDKNAWKS